MLRKINRIRSVQGTLAIEQNVLTVEQVTAVLNGKMVLAPLKDIAEIKYVYEMQPTMKLFISEYCRNMYRMQWKICYNG